MNHQIAGLERRHLDAIAALRGLSTEELLAALASGQLLISPAEELENLVDSIAGPEGSIARDTARDRSKYS